jgi:hypothetical protein
MRTSEIFKNKTALSFEIFPPQRTASIGIIYNKLDELQGLNLCTLLL